MWIYGFSVLIFVFVIQLFFLLYIFYRPLLVSKKNILSFPDNELPPISVIICAKNEEENLEKFLTKVLEQNYPNFEVIVVDDASEDNTTSVLKEFSLKFKNLSFVSIQKEPLHEIGKKYPLTVGIKKAKNEILILTDADCYPVSENWLKNIVYQYKNESTEIVLAYGGYEKEKSLVNYFIRFDTLTIAMQYFSMAAMKLAYMGVGRNLSYKKSIFLQHKGFKNYLHLSSGDDDLIVKKMATKNNVSFTLKSDSQTLSIPKKTFKSWTIQKNRHLSTGKFVNKKVKLLNAAYPLSLLIFITLAIILFENNEMGYVIVSLVVLRYVVFYIISFQWCKTLNEKDLFIFSPILEILLIPIYIYFAIFSFLTKKIQWK